MGRFYKTAKPTFVQNGIHTPPWELMAKVIGNADSQIEKNETALHSLYDKLDAESLKVDEPRLKEVIESYKNKIDEVNQKLIDNPLEFRREMGTIRTLGRDIHTEWTKGEVAAIQGNKKAYDGWVKRHLEKVKAKKGYITQGDMNYAQSKFLKDFAGTNYQKNGVYDNIALEDLNKYVNVENLGEERAKGYMADAIKRTGAFKKGGYLYTSENSNEKVDPKVIFKGVLSSMKNDKELMDYYNQQEKLGALQPGQKELILQRAALRVADKYGYQKDTQGLKSIKADPYGLEAYKQKNRLALVNFKDGLKNKNLLIGTPEYDSAWANEKLKKEWDETIYTKLGDLAKLTNVKNLEDVNDIPSYVSTLRNNYQARVNAAVAKGMNENTIKKLQQPLTQLNRIESSWNNGQAKVGWSHLTDLITLKTGNQQKAIEIAGSMKKNIDSYIKDGTLNDFKGTVENIEGFGENVTINDLISAGIVDSNSLIENSGTPAPMNNLSSEGLNGQWSFKLKVNPKKLTDEIKNDPLKMDMYNKIKNSGKQTVEFKVPFDELGLNYRY